MVDLGQGGRHPAIEREPVPRPKEGAHADAGAQAQDPVAAQDG